MKYNKFLLDVPIKIPLNSTEDLKKILLILDTYDLYWLDGERPLDYIIEIEYFTNLVITSTYKLCIRSSYEAKTVLLKDILEL